MARKARALPVRGSDAGLRTPPEPAGPERLLVDARATEPSGEIHPKWL